VLLLYYHGIDYGYVWYIINNDDESIWKHVGRISVGAKHLIR